MNKNKIIRALPQTLDLQVLWHVLTSEMDMYLFQTENSSGFIHSPNVRCRNCYFNGKFDTRTYSRLDFSFIFNKRKGKPFRRKSFSITFALYKQKLNRNNNLDEKTNLKFIRLIAGCVLQVFCGNYTKRFTDNSWIPYYEDASKGN